jgi:hypothetical protein
MQDQVTEQASKIGTEHGRNAASWVFDGNTSDGTYRRVLAGIEDGDPMIMDAHRTPDLSGEFVGDYSESQLITEVGLGNRERMPDDDWTEAVSEAATAYSDAASEAFWAEVERTAREHVLGGRIERLRSAGFPVRWAFRPDEHQA